MYEVRVFLRVEKQTTGARRHRAKRSLEPIWGGGMAKEQRRVRNYAGKVADCCAKFGFPSPPRDGCPMELFAIANRGHESARKFGQIRPVNPRLFGFLQGRAFFSRLAIFEQACGRDCQCNEYMQRRSRIAMQRSGSCGRWASFQLPVCAAWNHSCA